MTKDHEIQGGISYSTSYNDRLTILSEQLNEKRNQFGQKSEQAAWSLRNLAEAQRRSGNYLLANQNYSAARAIFEELSQFEGIVWCLWGEASIECALLNIDLAKQSLLNALEIADKGTSRDAIVWTEARLTEIDRIQGNYSIALVDHERVLASFAEIGDKRGIVWALQGIAQIARLLGQYERTLESLRQSFEISQELQDPRGIAYYLKGVAWLELSKGNLACAENHYQEAADIFTKLDYSLGATFCLLGLAETYMLSANISKVGEVISLSKTQIETMSDPRNFAYWNLFLADKARYELKLEEAQTLYEMALHTFQSGNIKLGMTRCLLGLCDIYRIKKDFHSTFDCMADICNLCTQTGLAVEKLHLAILECVTKDPFDDEKYVTTIGSYEKLEAKLALEKAAECVSAHLLGRNLPFIMV